MACSQVEGILCRLPHAAPPPPLGVAQEGEAIIASTALQENDVKTARAHRQLVWVERRRQVPVAQSCIPLLLIPLFCSPVTIISFCVQKPISEYIWL